MKLIIKRRFLSNSKHFSRIHRFLKFRLPVFTLCVLILGSLSLGEVIYTLGTSSRSFGLTSQYPGYPGYEGLNPYSVESLMSNKFIAPGQRLVINVSSTVKTTIRVYLVTIGEMQSDKTDLIPYISINQSNHHLVITSSTKYSLFGVDIEGLENTVWHYEGSISIQGSDFYLSFITISIFIFLFIIVFLKFMGNSGINFLLSVLKRHSSDVQEDVGYKTSRSSLSRIKLLIQLQRQELGVFQVAVISIISWLTIQPFPPIPYSPMSSP